jgi:uncharacterized lipoprotein YbaY
MRKLHGVIRFPESIPTSHAEWILVEVRDTTMIDAPSRVVAEIRMAHILVAANKFIPFDLEIPSADSRHSLSLRIHVDISGRGRVTGGDLLTTELYPIEGNNDINLGDVFVHII